MVYTLSALKVFKPTLAAMECCYSIKVGKMVSLSTIGAMKPRFELSMVESASVEV